MSESNSRPDTNADGVDAHESVIRCETGVSPSNEIKSSPSYQRIHEAIQNVLTDAAISVVARVSVDKATGVKLMQGSEDKPALSEEDLIGELLNRVRLNWAVGALERCTQKVGATDEAITAELSAVVLPHDVFGLMLVAIEAAAVQACDEATGRYATKN